MTDQPHVAWRQVLGDELCRAYAVDPAVVATTVVGSVARGWADAFSDVEILVVWDGPPSDATRRGAVERAGGRINVDWAVARHDEWRMEVGSNDGHVGELWPFQDDESAEHFPVRGLPVGVSGFTAATIDAICDQLLVERRATDDAEVVASSSILDGWDVSGTEHLAAWRHRLATYRTRLAASVVMPEIDIDPEWWGGRRPRPPQRPCGARWSIAPYAATHLSAFSWR